VLAAINTVFAQDSVQSAIEQWRIVADQLRLKFPKCTISSVGDHPVSPVEDHLIS
jgi:hypothetical protein